MSSTTSGKKYLARGGGKQAFNAGLRRKGTTYAKAEDAYAKRMQRYYPTLIDENTSRTGLFANNAEKQRKGLKPQAYSLRYIPKRAKGPSVTGTKALQMSKWMVADDDTYWDGFAERFNNATNHRPNKFTPRPGANSYLVRRYAGRPGWGNAKYRPRANPRTGRGGMAWNLKGCAPGEMINPGTGLCVKKTGAIGRALLAGKPVKPTARETLYTARHKLSY